MVDYKNMSLREELEDRFKAAENQYWEQKLLEHGWQRPVNILSANFHNKELNVQIPYIRYSNYGYTPYLKNLENRNTKESVQLIDLQKNFDGQKQVVGYLGQIF